jgi:hypothetical protein
MIFYRTSCGMGCMILWFSTAWAHFCSCFMRNGPLGGAIHYKLLEIVRFFPYIYCFRYCISELNKLITRAHTWLGGTSDCHIPTTRSHLSRSELYTSAEHGPMCAVTPFTTVSFLSKYPTTWIFPCHVTPTHLHLIVLFLGNAFHSSCVGSYTSADKIPRGQANELFLQTRRLWICALYYRT